MKGRTGLWLRILVSAGVLVLLFTRILPRDVLGTLGAADPFFLVAALGILVVERALCVLRWVLLVRASRPEVSVRDAVSVFFLSNFVGLALPVSVGGDLARLLGTRRVVGRMSEAFLAVLHERIFGLLSLLLALALGFLVAPVDAFGGVPRPWIVGAGVFLLVLLLVPLHLGSVMALSRALDRGFTRTLAAKLVIYSQALGARRIGIPFGVSLSVLSLAIQILKILFTFALGLAVGIDLPLVYYLGFVPVVNLVAQLPVSLGGVGLREGAFVVLLSGILGGVEEAGARALAVSVLSYVGVLLASSPGLPCLLSKGRLPAVPLRTAGRIALVTVLALALGTLALGISAPLRGLLPWQLREAVERVLVRGSLLDKRPYLDLDGARVTVPSGHLVLRGRIYVPARKEEKRHPAIVLVHGSNPLGSELGLYRVLSRELSRRGFLVLAVDLAGFGDSDDPEGFDDADLWSGLGDVHASIDWLLARDDVDPASLSLVGHSLGAGVVAGAGLEDPRVRAIVCLGPGRRLGERLEDEGERERSRRRFAHDRGLPGAVPWELVDAITQAHRIELRLDVLGTPDHPPILLADGALEDPLDLAFLERLCASIAPPRRLLRVPDTSHYLNVQGLSRDDRCGLFDRAVMIRFVDEVVVFLGEAGP